MAVILPSTVYMYYSTSNDNYQQCRPQKMSRLYTDIETCSFSRNRISNIRVIKLPPVLFSYQEVSVHKRLLFNDAVCPWLPFHKEKVEAKIWTYAYRILETFLFFHIYCKRGLCFLQFNCNNTPPPI